jgi:hypothetical protein
MTQATDKAYALYAFSLSGRPNLLCAVCAKSKEEAAKKMGGRTLDPSQTSQVLTGVQQELCRLWLPPFTNDWSVLLLKEGSERLLSQIQGFTKEELVYFEKQLLGANHLIIAHVPFIS